MTLENILYQFHSFFKCQVHLAYKGSFDKNIIAIFGEKIHAIKDIDSKIQKKIFSIFIELVQNISYYSSEKSNLEENKNPGVGSIIIGENTDEYIFSTGNIISNEEKIIIEKKCNLINSLPRNELRELKRKQRSLIPGTNDGANIGLIMVSLLTKKKLEVDFVNLTNRYFFTIFVRIKKV